MKAFEKCQRFALLPIMIFILLTGSSGCEQPRIFAPQERAKFNADEAGSSEQAMIQMQVTGGFAAVHWQLLIYENGFIKFLNSYPVGGFLKNILTAEEFARLKSAFIENDFFYLGDRYVTPGAADVFYYEITFRQDDRVHSVFADYLAAPDRLQKIIDLLNGKIESLRQGSPVLELITGGADTIKIGASLTLKLRAQNQSNQALKLTFSSGQLFDFFAIPFDRESVRIGIPAAKIWNWAQGRVFTQAIVEMTLPAGESLEYEIQWDGRDRDGNLLKGEFWLGAELASTPGGGTPLKRIYITQ